MDSIGTSTAEPVEESPGSPERPEPETAEQAAAALSTIYNDAPIGLAVVGIDGRDQRINNVLAQMNGCPASAVVRQAG